MNLRHAAAILLFATALGGPAHAKDAAPADLAALLDGVGDIGSPGLPGTVAVGAETAFPVVVGGSGKSRVPVVAAAAWGRGRVVAFASLYRHLTPGADEYVALARRAQRVERGGA